MDIKPVWEDNDDYKLNMKTKTSKLARQLNSYENKDKNHLSVYDIEQSLKNKYDSIKKTTNRQHKWAENSLFLVEDSRNEPELNKFLKSNASIIDSNRLNSVKKVNHNYNLTDKNKSYTQCKNLNSLNQHRGVVTNVLFSQFVDGIVCTSGKDRMLYIYNKKDLGSIDGDESEVFKLSNYFLTKDMPILATHFLNKEEILISGRRKHYFTYNLEKNLATKYIFNSNSTKQDIVSLEHCFASKSGEYYSFTSLEGNIFLFDSKTKQLRDFAKINGSATSLSFSNNGFLVSSNQGEIYIFDIRKTSTCVKKFDDEGSYNTLNIDVSSNNKYLASSSITGIVNLYEMGDVLSGNNNVKTIKVIYFYF